MGNSGLIGRAWRTSLLLCLSQFQLFIIFVTSHKNTYTPNYPLIVTMNFAQWKQAYPSDNPSVYYYHYQYNSDAHQPFAPQRVGLPTGQDNGRKQIRRETAGKLMANLWNGRPEKQRISTAQPRPRIIVPPRGIGPVRDLNVNDVLCGRGGRINCHPGNVQFRELVKIHKKQYLAKSTKKLAKAHIAAQIVQHIRCMHPAGRFMKEENDGSWYDVGDKHAIKKVGQALREDAPEVRQELDTGSTDQSCYEPLAFQHITPPPSSSQPVLLSMVLPQTKFGSANRGGALSGAAAAAMEQQAGDNFLLSHSQDTAFGRQFHPPPGVDIQRDSSLISAMSGPSVMSGLYASDEPNHISSLSNDNAEHYCMREASHGFYSPKQTQMQSSTQQRQVSVKLSLTNSQLTETLEIYSAKMGHLDMGDTADHCLLSGDMWESSLLVAGGGSVSSMQSITMRDVAEECELEDCHGEPSQDKEDTRSSNQGRKLQQMAQPYPCYNQSNQMPHPDPSRSESWDESSVASMSVNSNCGSISSVPSSFLADLSLAESLNALDLTEL
jgi:hypothetical protein